MKALLLTFSLTFLLFAGCDRIFSTCHDTGCDKGELCHECGECFNPFKHEWTVTIRSADVSNHKPDGYYWDAEGDSPDIKAVLSINDNPVITTEVQSNDGDYYGSAVWFAKKIIRPERYDVFEVCLYDYDREDSDFEEIVCVEYEGISFFERYPEWLNYNDNAELGSFVRFIVDTKPDEKFDCY